MVAYLHNALILSELVKEMKGTTMLELSSTATAAECKLEEVDRSCGRPCGTEGISTSSPNYFLRSQLSSLLDSNLFRDSSVVCEIQEDFTSFVTPLLVEIDPILHIGSELCVNFTSPHISEDKFGYILATVDTVNLFSASVTQTKIEIVCRIEKIELPPCDSGFDDILCDFCLISSDPEGKFIVYDCGLEVFTSSKPGSADFYLESCFNYGSSLSTPTIENQSEIVTYLGTNWSTPWISINLNISAVESET